MTRPLSIDQPEASVRLGLVQHACPVDTLDNPARNLQTAVAMIRDAAAKGAQIIATQELFNLPYFAQVENSACFDLAEPIPGPTTATLCALARELGVQITASLFEKRAQGVFHNTSVMIGRDGALMGKYRKMHIPDDPCFFEKFYFTPGDAPAPAPGSAWGDSAWQVQEGPFARTGMLVCWDQWFPEAARLTALRGAQVLFYPTAIGFLDGESSTDQRQQREAWVVMQRSHAIANGVYVAAINRVGSEDRLRFWGTSMVIDPFGVVLAEAPVDQPAVLIVDCPLRRIDHVRQGWPFLRDRRIDAYGDLARRYIDR
jgi:N-carbamoylputrescine amidase